MNAAPAEPIVYELTGDTIEYDGPEEYVDPNADIVETLEGMELNEDQSIKLAELGALLETIIKLYTQ